MKAEKNRQANKEDPGQARPMGHLQGTTQECHVEFAGVVALGGGLGNRGKALGGR